LVEDTAEVKPESSVTGSAVDGIWRTLHNYISDMPCPYGTRPKLRHLIDRTEKEWANILAGREEPRSKSTPRKYTAAKKTIQPTRKAAVMRASPRTAMHLVEDMQPGDRVQLARFSKDLGFAFEMANTMKLQSGQILYLRRKYEFISFIGTEHPFKTAISAEIDISSKPLIEKLTFPGTRTIAVKVGYCHQFDMDVFFAGDGGVYLVDTEQVSGPYEAEKKLDIDWHDFSI
jgi:hypothetical protein